MSSSQEDARGLSRKERDRERRRSETERRKERGGTREMLEIGLVTPADNKWSLLLTEKVTCLKKEPGYEAHPYNVLHSPSS